MKRGYIDTFEGLDSTGSYLYTGVRKRTDTNANQNLNTSTSSANTSFFSEQDKTVPGINMPQYSTWRQNFLKIHQIQQTNPVKTGGGGNSKRENLLNSLNSFQNSITENRPSPPNRPTPNPSQPSPKPHCNLTPTRSPNNQQSSQSKNTKLLQPILNPDRPPQKFMPTATTPFLNTAMILSPNRANTVISSTLATVVSPQKTVSPQANKVPPPNYTKNINTFASSNNAPSPNQRNPPPKIPQQWVQASNIQQYNMQQGINTQQPQQATQTALNMSFTSNTPLINSFSNNPNPQQVSTTPFKVPSSSSQSTNNTQSGNLFLNLLNNQSKIKENIVISNPSPPLQPSTNRLGINFNNSSHQNNTLAPSPQTSSPVPSFSLGATFRNDQQDKMPQMMQTGHPNHQVITQSFPNSTPPSQLQHYVAPPPKVPSLFQPNSFHYQPDPLFEQEMQLQMQESTFQEFLFKIRDDFRYTYEQLEILCKNSLKRLDERQDIIRVVGNFQSLDQYLPPPSRIDKEISILHQRQNKIEDMLNQLEEIFPEQCQHLLVQQLRDSKELQTKVMELNQSIAQDDSPTFSSILNLYQSLQCIEYRLTDMNEQLLVMQRQFLSDRSSSHYRSHFQEFFENHLSGSL